MLRSIMIVLAMAAALTGGLTADAFARGGGGGGGFGAGAHMGGGGRGGFVRNPTTFWDHRPRRCRPLKAGFGPTLVTRAGTPRQRTHVTARVPGHDRNRAMTPSCSTSRAHLDP